MKKIYWTEKRKDSETKKQKVSEEKNLFLQIFDKNIVELIFIQLFHTHTLSNQKEKQNFQDINDNFPLVCKLFYNISKQNLFNFIFNNIYLNVPYDIYLRLKHIKSNFNNSNIDDLLLHSCKEGFYSLIDILIQNNANINTSNTGTPLMKATLANKLKTIEKLFEYENLDFNYQTNYGNSALIIACAKGYQDIVCLFLGKKDLNLNLMNEAGYTSLMYASHRKHPNIVSLLISKEDTDLNLQNSAGNTVLMRSCCTRAADIVSLLISKENLDLNLTDEIGNTALIQVCQCGYLDIVSLLLQRQDLNLNLKNSDGKTAFMYAQERGYQDIVSLLLQR